MAEVDPRVRAEQQADICRVFANPTRILILWTLAEGEKSVGEIAEAVDASLQSTSQHLRIMRQMEILSSRRDGHMVFYQIAGGSAHEQTWHGCQPLLERAPVRVD
jgi:ArsR family transcriptional regulator